MELGQVRKLALVLGLGLERVRGLQSELGLDLALEQDPVLAMVLGLGIR